MKTPFAHRRRRLAGFCLLAGALLVLPACDDSDASNMVIMVRADHSGTIRSTRLVIPEEAGVQSPSTGGVTWSAEARVITTSGEFASLSDVKFEDVTFACESTARGLHVLRVTLPRGPACRWAGALTQPSADRRKQTTAAIFPEQKDSRLGSVVAITITLPSAPISHGVSPQIAGVGESADKNVATLTIRVDTAMKAGADIVWDLTWDQSR